MYDQLDQLRDKFHSFDQIIHCVHAASADKIGTRSSSHFSALSWWPAHRCVRVRRVRVVGRVVSNCNCCRAPVPAEGEGLPRHHQALLLAAHRAGDHEGPLAREAPVGQAGYSNLEVFLRSPPLRPNCALTATRRLASAAAPAGAVPPFAGRHPPITAGGRHQGHGRRPPAGVPHRAALHGNASVTPPTSPYGEKKRLNLIDHSAAVARLCRGRHGAHRGEEAAQLDPQVGRGRAPRRGAGLLRVSSRYGTNVSIFSSLLLIIHK